MEHFFIGQKSLALEAFEKFNVLTFLTFSKNIFFKSSFASALKHFVFFNFENTPTQLSPTFSLIKKYL
jgi:hypothetical protein